MMKHKNWCSWEQDISQGVAVLIGEEIKPVTLTVLELYCLKILESKSISQ